MAFHDTRFPPSISRGSGGGPRFGTVGVKVDSKSEARNGRWASPERTYNVVHGVKKPEAYAELLTFFMARRGALHSFRFKDWTDYASTASHITTGPDAVTPDDAVIGAGDGVEADFPLVKIYDDGFTTLVRPIALPVAGTVRVALDGSETTAFTMVTGVDDDGLPTAVVRFTTAPGAGVSVTAGFEFDVHARFGLDLDNAGLPGTLEGADNVSLDSVTIEEVFASTDRADFHHFGGATNHGSISASRVLACADGLVQVVDPSIGTLNLDLPDPTTRPLGGPHLILFNVSATNAIGIRKHDQTPAFTLAPNSTAEMYVHPHGGSQVWVPR